MKTSQTIEIYLDYNIPEDVEYIPREMPSRYSPGAEPEATLLRAKVETNSGPVDAPQWMVDMANEDRWFNDTLLNQYEEAAAAEACERDICRAEFEFDRRRDEMMERRIT